MTINVNEPATTAADTVVVDPPAAAPSVLEQQIVSMQQAPPSDDIYDALFGAEQKSQEQKAKDAAAAPDDTAPADPAAEALVDYEYNGVKMKISQQLANDFNAAKQAQAAADRKLAELARQPASAAQPQPIPNTPAPAQPAPTSSIPALPPTLLPEIARFELEADIPAGKLSPILAGVAQHVHSSMMQTVINPLLDIIEQHEQVFAEQRLVQRDAVDLKDIGAYIKQRGFQVDPQAAYGRMREIQQFVIGNGTLTEDEAYVSKRGEIAMQAILDSMASAPANVSTTSPQPIGELRPVATSGPQKLPLTPGASTPRSATPAPPRAPNGQFVAKDDEADPLVKDQTALGVARLMQLATRKS